MKFYVLKGSYKVFKTLNGLEPFRLGPGTAIWKHCSVISVKGVAAKPNLNSHSGMIQVESPPGKGEVAHSVVVALHELKQRRWLCHHGLLCPGKQQQYYHSMS